MYLDFAWRYFKAKKTANAINIIAWISIGVIAIAICCQLLVLSVFNGFEDLVKSLYSSFYTDLKVVPVRGKTFHLTPEQAARINKQAYVQSVSMIAEDKALLQNGDAQTVVYLKGVDENYSKVSGVAGRISNGNFNTGTIDEPGLILGSGIQNAAGISLNPAFAPIPVTLILPRKTTRSSDPLEALSEGNALPTGVFSIQQDFDNKYAITNIDFVKQQMGFEPDEFSSVEIRLKPGTDIEDAKSTLQQVLPGYLVQSRYEQNMNLYNTMRLEKWAIFAVLTLILIIAAFNMVSALTMLVLEKKKDIGILQSMGGSRTMIQKIFLGEGLLLGTIGAGLGIGLAVIICVLQLKFKLVKLQGGSFLIDYFPVKLIPGDFLLVGGTAIAISFIASWFPALKASHQPIELR
jgi:lipoprotein-releasing system permease protein